MQDLKRESMVDTTEKLLFDILQELKNLSKSLKPSEKTNEKLTAIDCKYCGKTHENNGQVMACAKKTKKREGAK